DHRRDEDRLAQVQGQDDAEQDGRVEPPPGGGAQIHVDHSGLLHSEDTLFRRRVQGEASAAAPALGKKEVFAPLVFHSFFDTSVYLWRPSAMDFDPRTPPCWTGDLPGIGGRIKSVPEDFEVEEVPAYAPSGAGDFLYLWVEKLCLGAEYFLRQVARRLELSPGEVGSAGLKDRHAVTRQMLSL